MLVNVKMQERSLTGVFHACESKAGSDGLVKGRRLAMAKFEARVGVKDTIWFGLGQGFEDE
jgi:hypothetical protein